MNWGTEAQNRLSQIAQCSLNENGVTRFPFTSEHRAALSQIQSWMETAGMTCHMDAAGTLIGRLEGTGNGPTFLIGSHQDSVRNGGRYDGIMGVLVGCLALQTLNAEGIALPYPVEVLAFADEEGVRFPTALLGPRALAGTVDPAIFDMKDRDGVTLRDALNDFGGNADRITDLKRNPEDVMGYLEAHIEQGPVLENKDLACGVVTGICGIERNIVTFTGETGHAGTVPMENRKDALVAASGFITHINAAALCHENLLATIGALSLHPNVVNGIPRHVELTLEIRSLKDDDRASFADQARVFGDQIKADQDITFEMTRTYEQPAVPCAEGLLKRLRHAVREVGQDGLDMPSGATHDASAMADLCEITMLFVRCRGGVSHTPKEFASDGDLGETVSATAEFLRQLGDGS